MNPTKETGDENANGGFFRHWARYPDIVIARTVGILCIASGFILGMHGLDHPETSWLQTALGCIVTGLIAQGYALVRSLTHPHPATHHEKEP